MDIKIKVVSEEIYAAMDDLLLLLEGVIKETGNMSDVLLKIDQYLECKGVENVKTRAMEHKTTIDEQMLDLRRHIEKLKVIAADYERTERKNKDGINESIRSAV